MCFNISKEKNNSVRPEKSLISWTQKGEAFCANRNCFAPEIAKQFLSAMKWSVEI